MEYASEAVKQGSVSVGLCSSTHVVLVGLKRNPEELGSYQKKLIKIDNHFAVALAGLASDARVLSNYLREQATYSKMVYDKPQNITKAAMDLGQKAQGNTQYYGSRPYGVGLLLAGIDENGAHLFEFSPSGTVLEYLGAAIGARSQAARTYLEREAGSLSEASKEDLIKHGLTALRDTLQQEKELTSANTSICVIGKDGLEMYDDENVKQWLDLLDRLTNRRRQEEQTGDAMETEE